MEWTTKAKETSRFVCNLRESSLELKVQGAISIMKFDKIGALLTVVVGGKFTVFDFDECLRMHQFR